jgi:type IV secretory pathway component VirB8
VQQLSRQQTSLSEYVKQREEFDSEEQKRIQQEKQSRRAEKTRLAELESERQKLEFNKNIKYGS